MPKIKSGKSSEKSINASKMIIFLFFTVYLIVYGIGIGGFVEYYQVNYPGTLPVFMAYVPMLCYVLAVFMGLSAIIFLKNAREHKIRETKSRKSIKGKSIYKQSLFLIIFIFSFIPLLSPIIDQGKNDQNFSVYNDAWNGCSDFMAVLDDEGYDCYNIQSSLSATERLNKSILLVIIGSNTYFNPLYEIPFFIDFFEKGNSILICHDHGSTSTLLYEIFAANMMDPNIRTKVPITIFPEGILRDNDSCLTNDEGLKDAEFPIIKSFTDHPTTAGIKKVLLSRSSCALGGPFIEFSGWTGIGYTSMYGFVDKNGDKMYKYEDDSYNISSMASSLGSDFPKDMLNIPLGGYPQAVFMAKDSKDSRVFVCADASLFDNELINEPGYDNRQLAINIVKWLTHGQDDWVVVIDESHTRPEYSRDLTSAGIFGFIIQYIVQLSTNPITAWIYPLLAIYTLRRYLPKKNKEEEEKKKKEKVEKEEEKLKFRTSSFFAKKIEWYREKSKYSEALTLLYRRLERKLNSLLSGGKITTVNVVNLITEKDPKISKSKLKRISKFMDDILLIKENKRKIKNEKEFEDMFSEMNWIATNI